MAKEEKEKKTTYVIPRGITSEELAEVAGWREGDPAKAVLKKYLDETLVKDRSFYKHESNYSHSASLITYKDKLYAFIGAIGRVYSYDGREWKLEWTAPGILGAPLRWKGTMFGHRVIDDVLYFAGTAMPYNGAVLKYDGVTWTLIDITTQVEGTGELFDIIKFGDYIYAGAYDDGVGARIIRSADEGETWELAHDFGAGTGPIHSLAVMGDYIYAGNYREYAVQRSADGITWANVLTTDTYPVSMVYALYHGGLFVGCRYGLLYKTTDGTTWEQYGKIPNLGRPRFIYAGRTWSAPLMYVAPDSWIETFKMTLLFGFDGRTIHPITALNGGEWPDVQPYSGKLFVLQNAASEEDNVTGQATEGVMTVLPLNYRDPKLPQMVIPLWSNVAIAADDESWPALVGGFDKKAVYFLSDTAGTLTIKADVGDDTFRTFDTRSISANEFTPYMTEYPVARLKLSFNEAATVTTLVVVGM